MKATILSVGFACVLGYLIWSLLLTKQDDRLSIPVVSKLELVGDECIGISEKAIIGLTATVEFQKQEILSRKANVMKNCMADRGFHENPAWREYTLSIAKANAAKQAISNDEAIENIRKIEMWIFKKQDSPPLYWASGKV